MTKSPPSLRVLIAVGLAGAVRLAAADAVDDLHVLEPAHAAVVAPRKPERARWSWDQAPAEVTASGDLRWKPEPFVFTPGKTVRYIDFAHGSDDQDGSKAKPWQHHPWDAQATGNAKACAGVVTYVFKRGVTYRGELHAHEDGAAGDPIRLTSDPAWGSGEAVISGAEVVTGWKQGAGRADIPDGEKVWWADLDYAPRALWTVQGGNITRVELARIPKWTVTNPEEVKSNWWRLEQPGWWRNNCTGLKVTFNGHQAHLGIDAAHLTGPAEEYVGATAHVEYGWVMGTPFPTLVEGFDAQRKGFFFQGIWLGDSEQVPTGMHYFLEDRPGFLSSPGEFWFDQHQHRLYARLPGDADPNTVAVEAARHLDLIDSAGMAHVAITGLTFRCTNYHWDLWQPGWGSPEVDNACIRVIGKADDVRIANCRFDHCAKAVRIDARARDQQPAPPFDGVAVDDNDIDQTDHGAIDLASHGVGDARVLRNHLHLIGLRSFRQDHSHALVVQFPATMEVAGNLLERCTAAGIFVFGGKPNGDQSDAPLARCLIHHNRVYQALLSANDWGAIETWQGGPFYTFDNIAGDPNGVWNGFDPKKPGSGRLGFAYYHDGSNKNYDFNDVAYGLSTNWSSTAACAAAFYEATPTIDNQIFNCTVSRFWVASQWSPAGGRHFFLGNVFDQIGGTVFEHGKLKEDNGPVPAAYPHAGTAYGRNVFSGLADRNVAVYEAGGQGYDTIDAMRASFAAHPALAMDVGTVAPASPLRDPDQRDFRLKPGSAAAGRGVKVFVPWALARTVGEWQFRRDNADPTRIHDDHWYMAPYYVNRDDYHAAPVWDLVAHGVKAGDFGRSPLEDWTDAALGFDGVGQYAALAEDQMRTPYAYEAGHDQRTAQRGDLASPDIAGGNLLIEVYLYAAAHRSGVVVAKMAGSGYQVAINHAGSVTVTLVAGGATAELAGTAIVADARWHHVVVEVDRQAGTGAIYTDGVVSGRGALALPAGASLANDGDLYVGKDAAGHFFTGAIGFLRIARSTLAESRTSIEELYDWEFDGPFLRDFAGKAPGKLGRDAGAFQGD